ncbi:hypothetical protein Tco_1026305 [Tanacetum coccineum]
MNNSKLRRRDDEDKDEESSARSNWGSKRRRAGKEPESTSALKEKTSKTTGKSTEGSKSHHKSAGESAQVEEPMHTAKDLEEPVHQEFKTGVTEDQPNEETFQHPDWFQKPANLLLPIMEDPRESFNELMDTSLDFSAFMMNRLKVDTLTLEILAGLTFELMKGSCKSLSTGISNGLKIWSLTQCGVQCRESARDVYSKRRIIVVTNLQIVEWHNYKHQDWIAVRRDDDKLYKFKEGDFNRLRIQDIEDISAVIQRRVEDLQLGVESYQKKLNLTKPDTYISDLK